MLYTFIIAIMITIAYNLLVKKIDYSPVTVFGWIFYIIMLITWIAVIVKFVTWFWTLIY